MGKRSMHRVLGQVTMHVAASAFHLPRLVTGLLHACPSSAIAATSHTRGTVDVRSLLHLEQPVITGQGSGVPPRVWFSRGVSPCQRECDIMTVENIMIGQERTCQREEKNFSCSLNEGTHILIFHMAGKLCNLHCDGAGNTRVCGL